MGIRDRFKSENEAYKMGHSPSLSKMNSKKALFTAILGGIITAILAWLIPNTFLEAITGATGLSEIIPATRAPLGSSAKALFIIFSAIIVTTLILVMLLSLNQEDDMAGSDFHTEGPMRARNRMPVMDVEPDDRAIAMKFQQEDDERIRQAQNRKKYDKKTIDGTMLGGALMGGAVAVSAALKSQFKKLPFMGGDDRIRSFDDLPKLRGADRHPDAPARRPLFAHQDLGEKIMDRHEPNIAKRVENIENEDDLNEILNSNYPKPEPDFESQPIIEHQGIAENMTHNMPEDREAEMADFMATNAAKASEIASDYGGVAPPEMQSVVMQAPDQQDAACKVAKEAMVNPPKIAPAPEPAPEPIMTEAARSFASDAVDDAPPLAAAATDQPKFTKPYFPQAVSQDWEDAIFEELPEESLARTFKPAKTEAVDDNSLPSLDSLIARMERVVARQQKSDGAETNASDSNEQPVEQIDTHAIANEAEQDTYHLSEQYSVFEEVTDDEIYESNAPQNAPLREVYSVKPSVSNDSDPVVADKKDGIATPSQKAEMDSALKSALETLHKMADRSA